MSCTALVIATEDRTSCDEHSVRRIFQPRERCCFVVGIMIFLLCKCVIIIPPLFYLSKTQLLSKIKIRRFELRLLSCTLQAKRRSTSFRVISIFICPAIYTSQKYCLNFLEPPPVIKHNNSPTSTRHITRNQTSMNQQFNVSGCPQLNFHEPPATEHEPTNI